MPRKKNVVRAPYNSLGRFHYISSSTPNQQNTFSSLFRCISKGLNNINHAIRQLLIKK